MSRNRTSESALAAILAAATPIAGCHPTLNDSTWHETVRLASGEDLNVKHHVRFHEHVAFGGGATGQAFDNSALEWSSDGKTVIRWSAPMRPFLIDRDPNTDEWLVVANGGSEGGFYEVNGSPCPPQWAFRLREGTWFVQPVPVDLIGRRANVLVELRVDDGKRFPTPSFDAEAQRRKARFEARPSSHELETYVVGAIGQHHVCEGRAPQFRTPFTVNDTIPGLDHFPRIP